LRHTHVLIVIAAVAVAALAATSYWADAKTSAAGETSGLVSVDILLKPPLPSEADEIRFQVSGWMGDCFVAGSAAEKSIVVENTEVVITLTVRRYGGPCPLWPSSLHYEAEIPPLLAGEYTARAVVIPLFIVCDDLSTVCGAGEPFTAERSFTVVAGTTPGATSTPSPTSTPTPSRTSTPTATPTPAAGCSAGDVNADGTLDARDAQLLLQYVAGLLGALPCPAGGDVDGDGGIDAMDEQAVLQRIAGFA
jgi:hypothetical protein